MPRISNRAIDSLRDISFQRKATQFAEGSCLVQFGNTHVLCTATLEEKPPPWLRGQNKGWVTAEYAMLPRATQTRTKRDGLNGKPSGRNQEIQRLIGRSLRAVVDLKALGERQIMIDCDVLQADGGTRTAAITGGFVALHDCLTWMYNRSIIKTLPIKDYVAAISCGIVGDEVLLDLDFAEDSNAQTDANFVMTQGGNLVEIQASAEGQVFTDTQFSAMLDLARSGLTQIFELQKKALTS